MTKSKQQLKRERAEAHNQAYQAEKARQAPLTPEERQQERREALRSVITDSIKENVEQARKMLSE